ncbi:hypothetical protein pb186bvf_010877 [Paramecium bursaria]
MNLIIQFQDIKLQKIYYFTFTHYFNHKWRIANENFLLQYFILLYQTNQLFFLYLYQLEYYNNIKLYQFMYILQLAKNLDMLGLDLSFQINRNGKYTTYAGLFFTFTRFTFMIISFIQRINDIQNDAHPITQRTSELLQQDEGISIPVESFLFMVYVGDPYTQYIENTNKKKYYTLKFEKWVYGTELKQISYEFGKCNEKTLEYLATQSSNLQRNQLSSCLRFDMHQDMTIENSVQHENFSKFVFQIHMCQFHYCRLWYFIKTLIVCASNEEIDAKLQKALVICSFPQYEFNALNYLSILNQNRIMNLVYRQSQFYTEQNAFYFFPQEKLDVGLEYYESYFDLQSGITDNCLRFIQLYIDNQKYVYHRTYQNIFNIFGALGGTFSVLRTIFVLILKPIQKLSFVTSMFNKISGQKKKLRFIDFFKVKKQRKIIYDYYQIIHQAMELESYLDMILKYENSQLTFRSERLIQSNFSLLKAQRVMDIPIQSDRGEKLSIGAEDIVVKHINQEIIRAKKDNYSSDYICIDNNIMSFLLFTKIDQIHQIKVYITFFLSDQCSYFSCYKHYDQYDTNQNQY